MEEFYRQELESFLDYATYYKLNPKEVYNLLASYGVNEGTKGQDRTELKNRCAFFAQELIDYYRNNGIKLYSTIQDQGSHFRHINVTFDKSKDRGIRDVIKLYIPIRSEALEVGTNLIYNFLFQNRINFSSKISGTERAEMFVLRVDSVLDAKKVINFCSSREEIYRNYTCTNPFLAHINGIGIAKDTYEISYNGFMAECISEYANTHDRKESYASDFMEFMKTKYYYGATSKDRYMAMTSIENLLSITGDSNVLETHNDTYDMEFDPAFFYSYQRYRIKNTYEYFYKDAVGNRIDMQTNPKLYIALQAQNCIHKMYTEDYSTREEKVVPTKKFRLPQSTLNKISSTLDRMMDVSTPISSIETNYKSSEVYALLPYLYAQFAEKYKCADIHDMQKIISEVSRKQRIVDYDEFRR